MDKFQPGDCVILKSGGPQMTVSSIDEKTKIAICTWFDGSKLKSERFNNEIIVKQEKIK